MKTNIYIKKISFVLLGSIIFNTDCYAALSAKRIAGLQRQAKEAGSTRLLSEIELQQFRRLKPADKIAYIQKLMSQNVQPANLAPPPAPPIPANINQPANLAPPPAPPIPANINQPANLAPPPAPPIPANINQPANLARPARPAPPPPAPPIPANINPPANLAPPARPAPLPPAPVPVPAPPVHAPAPAPAPVPAPPPAPPLHVDGKSNPIINRGNLNNNNNVGGNNPPPAPPVHAPAPVPVPAPPVHAPAPVPVPPAPAPAPKISTARKELTIKLLNRIIKNVKQRLDQFKGEIDPDHIDNAFKLYIKIAYENAHLYDSTFKPLPDEINRKTVTKALDILENKLKELTSIAP